MPNSCVAYNCTNRFVKGGKISFHSFPRKNQALRNEWILKTRRKDWVPKSYSRICSAHFTADDYETYIPNGELSARLKRLAVPTVFNFNKPKRRKRYRTKKWKGKVLADLVSDDESYDSEDKTYFLMDDAVENSVQSQLHLQESMELGLQKSVDMDGDLTSEGENDFYCKEDVAVQSSSIAAQNTQQYPKILYPTFGNKKLTSEDGGLTYDENNTVLNSNHVDQIDVKHLKFLYPNAEESDDDYPSEDEIDSPYNDDSIVWTTNQTEQMVLNSSDSDENDTDCMLNFENVLGNRNSREPIGCLLPKTLQDSRVVKDNTKLTTENVGGFYLNTAESIAEDSMSTVSHYGDIELNALDVKDVKQAKKSDPIVLRISNVSNAVSAARVVSSDASEVTEPINHVEYCVSNLEDADHVENDVDDLHWEDTVRPDEESEVDPEKSELDVSDDGEQSVQDTEKKRSPRTSRLLKRIELLKSQLSRRDRIIRNMKKIIDDLNEEKRSVKTKKVFVIVPSVYHKTVFRDSPCVE